MTSTASSLGAHAMTLPSPSSTSSSMRIPTTLSAPRSFPRNSPTGAPTVATSVVTAVGSMSHTRLCSLDMPPRAGESSSTGTSVSPPSTVIVTPPAPTPATPAEQPVTITTADKRRGSGNSIHMRRSVVVGGRNKARRKRGAVFRSTTSTSDVAAAMAAAQQEQVQQVTMTPATTGSTLTKNNKAHVTPPPPSPKQLQVQEPTVAVQAGPRSLGRVASAAEAESLACTLPQHAYEAAFMARQAAQEEYYDEEEQEAELATSRLVHPRSLGEYECAQAPVTTCVSPRCEDGMYCANHICQGANVESDNCYGLGINTEQDTTDNYSYDSQRLSATLDEYTAPPTRATEPNGEELLEWFENTFGHILNCPLPQPDRRWQPHSDNDGSAMTPAPSPSSRTTPLPSAQPAINQRWANPQVDKWWEGRWPHHVKVPIELQIRAENQAYQNDVRSRRNSDASEFGPSHPLSPNMGGPGRVPPARDPMAASLMSDYHRLNQSSRWQLTRSPRGLQRHLTA